MSRRRTNFRKKVVNNNGIRGILQTKLQIKKDLTRACKISLKKGLDVYIGKDKIQRNQREDQRLEGFAHLQA